MARAQTKTPAEVPGKERGMLCDCSCAKPCPFGKAGMSERCTLVSLADHFGCELEQALEQLHEWWPVGEALIDYKVKAMLAKYKIGFMIVEAERGG